MANIVNDVGGAAMDPREPTTKAFFKRRKNLLNHVSFDDLYGYNGVISDLRGMSSTLFTKFIDTLYRDAKAAKDTEPFYNSEFRVPGDGNTYGSFTYTLNTDKLTDDDRPFTGGDVPEEIRLHGSIIEILDPYNGALTVLPGKDHTNTFSRLKLYTSLGLYPMICRPLSEDEVYASMEKYDHLELNVDQHIGMIIDVYEEVLANEGAEPEYHVFAVCLWHPMYTLDMPDYMYGHFSGNLTMFNTIPTPQCWNDPGYTFEGNFGIPVYLYTPDRSLIFHINNSARCKELINTAVVSGSINLEYTQFLVDKLAKVTQEMGTVHPIDETAAVITGIQDEPEAQEEKAEEVPVINAQDTDDYAERMKRLFQPPPRTEEEDDLFYGSITETLIRGNYPIIG